jgi:hypothetical protein
MDHTGALSIEEWRPRWPPLWVHSTNLLKRITASAKKFSNTPDQPSDATNDKSQAKKPHKKHLAKAKCDEITNAHRLPARPHEVPRVIHSIDKNAERNDGLDGIANAITIALFANAIIVFGDAAHFGSLRFNVEMTGEEPKAKRPS